MRPVRFWELIERQTAIQIVLQAVCRTIISRRAEIMNHLPSPLPGSIFTVRLPDRTQSLCVFRPFALRQFVQYVHRLVIRTPLLGRSRTLLVDRRPDAQRTIGDPAGRLVHTAMTTIPNQVTPAFGALPVSFPQGDQMLDPFGIRTNQNHQACFLCA